MTSVDDLELWIYGLSVVWFWNSQQVKSPGVTWITSGKSMNSTFLLLPTFTRAIMFHIGVATQHPPLPEPGQLSELGINFIKQCLTIDPARRPSAMELMNHPWMLDFRDTLLRYEAAELTVESSRLLPEDSYENPSITCETVIRTPSITELLEESPTS